MSIFKRTTKTNKPATKKKQDKSDGKKLDLGFRKHDEVEWTEEDRKLQQQYLQEFGWVRIR